jgi:predicted ester cyclase
MSEENKALVRKFFDLLVREGRAPEELMVPDFLYHVPGVPPLDIEAVNQRTSALAAAFSDISRTLEDMVAEGDKVAFRSSIEMTHTGEYMGIEGAGTQISFTEIGIMRIASGNVAEMWALSDSVGFMQQIGAMPSPD